MLAPGAKRRLQPTQSLLQTPVNVNSAPKITAEQSCMLGAEMQFGLLSVKIMSKQVSTGQFQLELCVSGYVECCGCKSHHYTSISVAHRSDL